MKQTFVGFGFGAIQGGLFLLEAFKTGRFDRLVVAEVVPQTVEKVRRNNGTYRLNIATEKGIEMFEVEGVEIYNPLDVGDQEQIVAALADASEISTALPSVDFYNQGAASVAKLVAAAVSRKLKHDSLPNALLYTAENNNHAAEILSQHINAEIDHPGFVSNRIQFLNTVIGKMSGVVTDPGQIRAQNLEPLTPDASSAFLVESFNRILIDRVSLPDAQRNITVFEEKINLFPFEEAKLYGHNATHALLGYLAHASGCRYISDAAHIPGLIRFAEKAFLEESGAALIRKYQGIDPLFTEAGFSNYVTELLGRMLNPHLSDRVERVIRDPIRKLAWNDRLIGTMRLALGQGIQPIRFATAAAAAATHLALELSLDKALQKLWIKETDQAMKDQLLRLIEIQ